MRWLKRQTLAVGGEQGLQLQQRCTCSGGHHQLARLITDDACQRGGVEQLAFKGLGIKIFATPTPNAQGGSGGDSAAHAVNEMSGGISG